MRQKTDEEEVIDSDRQSVQRESIDSKNEAKLPKRCWKKEETGGKQKVFSKIAEVNKLFCDARPRWQWQQR